MLKRSVALHLGLQALDLPDEFHRGKVLACALLCDITLSNQDTKFDQEYLCKFYATLHRCIIHNNQVTVHSISNTTIFDIVPFVRTRNRIH
jgi:hypothetical protein